MKEYQGSILKRGGKVSKKILGKSRLKGYGWLRKENDARVTQSWVYESRQWGPVMGNVLFHVRGMTSQRDADPDVGDALRLGQRRAR